MNIDKLHWNVIWHDFNRNRIVEYDIFSHGGFTADLKKANKTARSDEEFITKVDSILMHYFWAKAEHEIIIKGMFDNDKSTVKVDVYAQIKLNWDRFVEYLLANR